MSKSISFTNEQYNLLLTFARHVVPSLQRKATRKVMRDEFYLAAAKGETRRASVEIVKMLSGIEYSEEAIVPFIAALERHLNGNNKRKKLSNEEKKIILKQYGFKCPVCGKTLTIADFDHIIPFYIVFDTMGLENIQCMCKECHQQKGVLVPEEHDLVYNQRDLAFA